MAEKPTIPDFPTLPDFGKMITQACEVVASVRGIPYDFNGTLSLENKFVVLFKTVKEMFDAQDELVKSYKALYDFVNNYFTNLDVQEEINRKIDELVNSGMLDGLFKKYIPYVTPQMYGAKGDGVTDDTIAFQKCFNANKKIVVPRGEYNVNNCTTIYDTNMELDTNADINITGDCFLTTDKPISITGGRFYGETKDPNSRYYTKVAISGKITTIDINGTKFFQCITLKHTSDNNYCGFINCNNMWVYDSLFIIAKKSLNYVNLTGCVLQNASNMLEATNFENISFTGCSIEHVQNLFSPIYKSAPYNGITINNCYVEYSSLFLHGNCKNIVINYSWIYTNITPITLKEGPGNCTISDNIITLLDNTLLCDTEYCSVFLCFGVGSIKQNDVTITRQNVAKIYSGNCILDIKNIDERYLPTLSDSIMFTGKFDFKKRSLTFDADTNKLYFNTGVTGLKQATSIPIMTELGRSDLLQITPPTGCLAIEQATKIMYSFDGTHWRKCNDGSILT
jgi:hypothetical protein|nr:MAG TPA_asm: tail spike protein [Caudoviricetes sp.]